MSAGRPSAVEKHAMNTRASWVIALRILARQSSPPRVSCVPPYTYSGG
jgi:hypothetical protein